MHLPVDQYLNSGQASHQSDAALNNIYDVWLHMYMNISLGNFLKTYLLSNVIRTCNFEKYFQISFFRDLS